MSRYRLLTGVLLATGVSLATLSGCNLGKASTAMLIVDFKDAQATAARDTVRTKCGSLPGVTVVPPRARDVSVYFDIKHATNVQVNALGSCVDDLAGSDPGLGIRGYRIDDGSMS